MKTKYKNWIKNYVAKHNGNVKNRCWSATKEMAETFPELKCERGWAHIKCLKPFDKYGIYTDQHWWCVDPDGNIIDPTASQYESEIVKYEAYDEEIHGPLPTGKCMNCGSFVYDNKNFCDEICEKAILDYLYAGCYFNEQET